MLKSIYISVYTTLLSVVAIHSAINVVEIGIVSAWTGILIAILPSLFFFVRLFVSPVARTSSNLNGMLIPAVIGSVLAVTMASSPQEEFYAYLYACGLGVAGALLYIYWYSSLGRTDSEDLSVGQVFPEISLKNSDGEGWNSKDMENHPALILFFRGNWCPLCMAQIKEISNLYRQLESMGVSVFLVSPQPDKHTKSLASKFDVSFNFMVDEDNQAAKRLGIEALQGTPKGLELLGYESDTVLPTAILTDSSGKIIFADQTDNYRVRPEPETFIRVFSEHGYSAD